MLLITYLHQKQSHANVTKNWIFENNNHGEHNIEIKAIVGSTWWNILCVPWVTQYPVLLKGKHGTHFTLNYLSTNPLLFVVIHHWQQPWFSERLHWPVIWWILDTLVLPIFSCKQFYEIPPQSTTPQSYIFKVLFLNLINCHDCQYINRKDRAAGFDHTSHKMWRKEYIWKQNEWKWTKNSGPNQQNRRDDKFTFNA